MHGNRYTLTKITACIGVSMCQFGVLQVNKICNKDAHGCLLNSEIGRKTTSLTAYDLR